MPIFWQIASEKPKHPSTSWANWKNWMFVAWNKDKQVEEEITLPKEFIVIAEWWNVKWYLADKWWVWSPEVFSFSEDIITIRDNNWWILIEGLWKDIKEKVKSWGLKLSKTVQYIDPKEPEVLKTFCIKWAALKSWMETFSDSNRYAAAEKKISLDKVAEGKTGAVKYTYPVFKVGTALTDEEKNIQCKMWMMLTKYHEETRVSKDDIEEKKVIEDDWDLPF